MQHDLRTRGVACKTKDEVQLTVSELIYLDIISPLGGIEGSKRADGPSTDNHNLLPRSHDIWAID